MKTTSRILIAGGLALAIASLPLLSGGLSEAEGPTGLWVHPRGDTFDPSLHYRAPDGEIFFKAENDIQGLGELVIDPSQRSRVTIPLGADLFEVVHRSKGELLPVLLWDADGDGTVDHLMEGRVEDGQGLFELPELAKLDLRRTYWQLSIRYVAGADGDPELDGRYLASTDSVGARVAYRRVDELPAVGRGPGLIVLKHREGVPFDFDDFVDTPARYVEDFDALSSADDGDDWTVGDDVQKGRLRTHFDREDLFIVRSAGDFELGVEWGDMELTEFLEQVLEVEADTDGCYSSLESGLKMRDGSPVRVPNRLFYCPADHVALFDAPDGYQIFLSALHGDAEVFERTEAGTSIGDNVRLYINEINPRSPSSRSTGTIRGNVRSSLNDASADLKDFFRHLFIGTYPKNIHTGQDSYRPSLVTAVPMAAWSVVTLHPFDAIEQIVVGAASGIDAVADVVSAAHNGVVNPVVQASLGSAASPESADRVGDFLGALTQAAVKNLPFGERSLDAVSPTALYYHNRAFAPATYTRTDTQLNIDRVMTVVDILAIRAIDRHNDDSSDSAGDGGDDGGGGNGGGDNGGGGNGGGDATGDVKFKSKESLSSKVNPEVKYKSSVKFSIKTKIDKKTGLPETKTKFQIKASLKLGKGKMAIKDKIKLKTSNPDEIADLRQQADAFRERALEALRETEAEAIQIAKTAPKPKLKLKVDFKASVKLGTGKDAIKDKIKGKLGDEAKGLGEIEELAQSAPGLREQAKQALEAFRELFGLP